MHSKDSRAIPSCLDLRIKLIRLGAYLFQVLAQKLKVSELTIYRVLGDLRNDRYEICAKKQAIGLAKHLLNEPAATITGKEASLQ